MERLESIRIGDKPKQLIEEIAEDLLARFAEVSLIDKYDVYQHRMATLRAGVENEVQRISQRLSGRVKMLTERYATPLPKVAERVETLSAKVHGHLKRMGFVA
ncbi:MAG: hypothetical protein ACREHV_06710 [Rhizomicrobium sp.]